MKHWLLRTKKIWFCRSSRVKEKQIYFHDACKYKKPKYKKNSFSQEGELGRFINRENSMEYTKQFYLYGMKIHCIRVKNFPKESKFICIFSGPVYASMAMRPVFASTAMRHLKTQKQISLDCFGNE